MKESELVALKKFTRIFPSVPYARYVAQVGTAQSSAAGLAQGNAPVNLHSGVKILAVFASCRSSTEIQSRAVEGRQKNTSADEVPLSKESQARSEEAPLARKRARDETDDRKERIPMTKPCGGRSIYVRLQYDKTCIETLPLEVLRERHPQLLIDYLLGSSMWN